MRNLPSASSREKPSAVCVRSFVPNEQKSAHLGDLVGADARARQLDHRPAEVLDRRLLRGDALGQLAQPRELLAEADERMHDLDERRLARSLVAPRAAARTIARTCIS